MKLRSPYFTFPQVSALGCKVLPRDHGECIQHSSDSARHSGLGEDCAEEVAEGDKCAGQQPVEGQHDDNGGMAEGVQSNDGT